MSDTMIKGKLEKKKLRYYKISQAKAKLEVARRDIKGAIEEMPWGICKDIESTLEVIETKIGELDDVLDEKRNELKELEDRAKRQESREEEK